MNYVKYILWSQSSSQWTVLQPPTHTFLAVSWERPWKSVTLLSIGVAPPDQSNVLLLGQRDTHWSCPADKELDSPGQLIKHFSGAEKSHTKCLRKGMRMNQFLINRKENLWPRYVKRPNLTARGSSVECSASPVTWEQDATWRRHGDEKSKRLEMSWNQETGEFVEAKNRREVASEVSETGNWDILVIFGVVCMALVLALGGAGISCSAGDSKAYWKGVPQWD